MEEDLYHLQFFFRVRGIALHKVKEMKAFILGLCLLATLAIAYGQNGFNMNGWNNGWNRYNGNNWNGNWNGNNWNGNGWFGMNGWNGLNANMANINGGRDDAMLSEGVYDDASSVSTMPSYVTEPPVAIMYRGDANFVTSSHDDVMIVATSADDPTEGHVVVANGDSFGAYRHKTDV